MRDRWSKRNWWVRQKGSEVQQKAAIMQQEVENWSPAGQIWLTDGFPLAHRGFTIFFSSQHLIIGWPHIKIQIPSVCWKMRKPGNTRPESLLGPPQDWAEQQLLLYVEHRFSSLLQHPALPANCRPGARCMRLLPAQPLSRLSTCLWMPASFRGDAAVVDVKYSD